MSLKAELEIWAAALKAYDEENFEKALDLFSRIADSSKILTNMGLIYATLGEHEVAVEHFMEAVRLDKYLAVAYFQCGVSNFLLTRYDRAHENFVEALNYLRGNQAINYEQLGLKFNLYCPEVLYNKGLCLMRMGRYQEGMQDMREASNNKAIEDHKVIDEAIRDQGVDYMVFSVPVGILYRPSEKKLKNAAQKDFLGKPILVAASDPNDAFTDFTGATRLKQGIAPTGIYIDRPDMSPAVTRSATLPAVIPTNKPTPDPPKTTDIGRANTTTAVSLSARGTPRNSSENSVAPSYPPNTAGPALARAPTQVGPGRPGAGVGGPVRGLTIRRADQSSSATLPPAAPLPPAPSPPPKRDRLTEFIDNYSDAYAEAPPVPAPQRVNAADRVDAWANNPANAPTLSRMGSRSAAGSNYAPSSFGTMRRKPSRRPTMRRMQSRYEDEEEEGYVSGDYDDGYYDLTRIRVKIHYKDDVRGMALTSETSFEEFLDRIAAKFNKAVGSLGMKFQDEDGGKVTLADESDFELAIETARTASKGKAEGKLEIWCTDL